MNFALKLFIYIYKTVFSAHIGGACRFTPSCSNYALQAIETHSPVVASKLIFTRVLSCRPGGRFGLDPVPSRFSPRGPNE